MEIHVSDISIGNPVGMEWTRFLFGNGNCYIGMDGNGNYKPIPTDLCTVLLVCSQLTRPLTVQ